MPANRVSSNRLLDDHMAFLHARHDSVPYTHFGDGYIPTTENEIDQLLFSNKAKQCANAIVRSCVEKDLRDGCLKNNYRGKMVLTHAKSSPRLQSGDIAFSDPLSIIKKSEQKLCLVNKCMDEIIQDLEPFSDKQPLAKQTRYKSVMSSVNDAKKKVMEIVRLNNTERQRFSNAVGNNESVVMVDCSVTEKNPEVDNGKLSSAIPVCENAKRNYVLIEKAQISVDDVKDNGANKSPFPLCDSRNYLRRSFKKEAYKTDSSPAGEEHIYECIPNDFDEVVFTDIRQVPPALPPRPQVFHERCEKASISKLITRSPRMGTKMLHRQKKGTSIGEEVCHSTPGVADRHDSRSLQERWTDGNRRVDHRLSRAHRSQGTEYAVVTDYKKYTVNDVIESIRRVECT